jgi:hypothetical protein
VVVCVVVCGGGVVVVCVVVVCVVVAAVWLVVVWVVVVCGLGLGFGLLACFFGLTEWCFMAA